MSLSLTRTLESFRRRQHSNHLHTSLSPCMGYTVFLTHIVCDSISAMYECVPVSRTCPRVSQATSIRSTPLLHCKRALHFRKRALHFRKRALHFRKRALHCRIVADTSIASIKHKPTPSGVIGRKNHHNSTNSKSKWADNDGQKQLRY